MNNTSAKMGANFENNVQSVHLQPFPNADPAMINFKIDEKLVTTMDRVRALCGCALAIRDKHNLRIRLPLQKITVIGDNSIHDLEQFSGIILDEINIKSIEFTDDLDKFSERKLVPNFPKIGGRVGTKMPLLLRALKSSDWKILHDGSAEVAGIRLEKEEFILKLEPKQADVFVVDGENMLLLLDLNITPELELEGVARDLVRLIQQFRKEANLDITNRIRLSIGTNDDVLKKAIANHGEYIGEQTLTTALEVKPMELYDTENNNKDNNSAKEWDFIFEDSLNKNPLVVAFSIIKK